VVEIFEEFTEYFAVFGNRTYDGLDATNKVCVQRIIGYIFLVTPDQLEMTPLIKPGFTQCCNSYSLFVTSYSYSYITKNTTSYRYKLKCN
jgi:hypothetical protein